MTLLNTEVSVTFPQITTSQGQTFHYSLTGDRWAGSPPVITWSFAESTTNDLMLGSRYSGYPTFDGRFDAVQKQLARKAFQLWEDAGNIDFVEQKDSLASDIRIGWDYVHDPTGNTLGMATFWMEGTAITRASIQLDGRDKLDAYMGMDSPPPHSWSFFSTVAHEVGHTLGLGHSGSGSSLMYPYANGVLGLTEEDVATLVALYGQRQQTAGGNAVAPAETPSPGMGTVRGPVLQGVDTALYLSQNPDVASARMDPVQHFNTYGWREGRDPNAFFDVDYYLAANADVRAAGLNPLEHYLRFGWRESRNPSSDFNTDGYLDANPDVKLAGVNPLLHYLEFGYAEGRAWA